MIHESAPSPPSLELRSSLTQEVRTDLFVFGLPFWNASYEEVFDWWQRVMSEGSHSGLVLAFANAHTLNLTRTNSAFLQAMKAVDVRVNDGIGFRIASKMRGVETRYNLNGSDLVPRLLRESTRNIRVFVYGGIESASKGTAEALERLSPYVSVVGRCNGYVDPIAEALPAITAAKADVVLVALGHPRQELFCIEHRDLMNAKIVLPVGGLIDFLSNNKPRAPKLLRKTGLEWTYRLALEPKRMFGRYVGGIPIFLLRGLLTSKSDVLLSRKLSTGRNAGSSSGESPL